MYKRTARHTLVLVVTFFLSFIPQILQAQDREPPQDSPFSWPGLELNGYLQQGFVNDESAGVPSEFYISRARLGVAGSISDLISVNFAAGFLEPPNNTPRLVNGIIGFNIHPLLQVRTGQFVVPFGLEGPSAIVLHPLIRRSVSTLRMNPFTMLRDIGVEARGSQGRFGYAIAVVNGSGANRGEQLAPKDLLGRLGLEITEELEVGVSGHYGQYQPDPSFGISEDRYRAGVDVQYENEDLLLQGEYQFRQDHLTGGDDITMSGGYILAGFELTNTLNAIGRYSIYDPGTDIDDDHLTVLTTGLNYYFVGNNRLSVNYEFRNDQLNPGLGNRLTLQMQVVL